MPAQVTNYKCLACTGPLHFVGATGRLECDYCESSFTVEEIEAAMTAAEEKAAEAFAVEENKNKQKKSNPMGEYIGEEWNEEGMKVYTCASCGAELICDKTTAATSCPYCGNTTVIPGQLSGAIKPDLIIPFKLNKDQAIEALKGHYNKKPFLPKDFSSTNHVEEIQGVYVPFWLFDGVAEGDIYFDATKTKRKDHPKFEEVITDHYNVRRAGKMNFEKIPVDASVRMPDNHMDAIEPFDYSELTEFKTAYLPGFLADKYDVSVKESYERAARRAEGSVVQALRETVVGYDSVNELSGEKKFNTTATHYALMPVWMLATKYKDESYLFAMNGQTGKLVGDLPVDKKKYWITFFLIFVPLLIIMGLIMFR